MGFYWVETAFGTKTVMTVVVINAISVKEGGSLIVLQNLLVEMARLRPDWHWCVAINHVARARLPDLTNTTFHVYAAKQLAGWKSRLWYEIDLPRLIADVQADLLFSHTNYLPVRSLKCPALLLVQHAGHFSALFRRLTEERLVSWPSRVSWRLKGRWVKSSVRRAQCVTVQTEALALRIMAETGVPHERIRVIPHGIGQSLLHENLPSHPSVGQPVRIGYITKYGVQKNFAVLFAAAAQMKLSGILPVLVLTLSPDIMENQEVLGLAERYGVGQCIENHGELASPEIDALYRSLHIFVFPSLCESFGFPMVEAMAYGLPLLIADIDSNIEVAGDAGLKFNADDATALTRLIARLVAEPEWHQVCAKNSLERAAYFTWNKAAVATLEQMDKMLDNGIQR
jgi:glycosyltransferase involved in cell wall biosynthesis